MGNISCNSEENFLFPLEDMIFDLLNNLLIRNLSEEQMRAKLKSFFKKNDGKIIKEELLSIIMDTNNDNPNIAFQEKFIEKLFEKIGDLCTKNIMIFIYPLLCNKKNLSIDNFFKILIEKLGNKFTFAQFEKILIPLIELYTHDLTQILDELLECEEEKAAVKDINQKTYSLENIKNYISTILRKEELIEAGLWNENIMFEKIEPILEIFGLDEYSKIRQNIILYNR